MLGLFLSGFECVKFKVNSRWQNLLPCYNCHCDCSLFCHVIAHSFAVTYPNRPNIEVANMKFVFMTMLGPKQVGTVCESLTGLEINKIIGFFSSALPFLLRSWKEYSHGQKIGHQTSNQCSRFTSSFVFFDSSASRWHSDGKRDRRNFMLCFWNDNLNMLLTRGKNHMFFNLAHFGELASESTECWAEETFGIT